MHPTFLGDRWPANDLAFPPDTEKCPADHLGFTSDPGVENQVICYFPGVGSLEEVDHSFLGMVSILFPAP